MDVSGRLTSKGQITVPKPVREALGLESGEELLFRVEGDRAVLAKTEDFIDLAGAVAVPAAKPETPWDEVLRGTRAKRAGRRR